MKWRLRTASMFMAMTLILVAVGYIIGYFIDSLWIGMSMMLILSVLFSAYAYFFSKNSALRANNVRIVTEAEEPRLYAIVRSVSEKAGVPMPEVGISDEYMPNAFATGRNPKNAAVVATKGLLALLPDDQLEGVIAHEMAHVKNRDILVMSVASTMAAVLSYLSRYIAYAAMFGNGNNRNPMMYIISILVSLTVPMAAMLVQLGVSRNREYLADESGAKITGNPRALARALRSIESGVASPKNDYSDNNYANMWISNPIRKNKNWAAGLFSTHPPMDERIQRLEKLAVKMDSDPKHAYVEPADGKRREQGDV